MEALNNKRQYADDSFEFLLIYKDDSVKASSNDLMGLDSFVALIDIMPMRRRKTAQSKPDLHARFSLTRPALFGSTSP